ncbi:GTP-binding protein [Xanthobacter autotrophicus]|uniref:CobW family GTP-binding protein n=1 Tax=Xanthobacter TaxID=279 RepID=UPI0024ABA046|nr:GTP-binding protein [Xanthobacter autotrophicus]MDI4663500.1 GTP-binding protein [Xanthobacter autotrophicus]
MIEVPGAAGPRDPSPVDDGDDRIPVTLLTGFLGAGKTTLLNRLIKQPAMAGTAVLINEFGAVAIDHHLVESVDETMLVLDSGCVCCTVQGDLVKALALLHERLARREIPQIRRVVIETTGLADPLPVISTLMEERFVRARYRCDSVLTVVDASLGAGQLDRHREAVRQVAAADRLLITKRDLADRTGSERLDARLQALNPGAVRLAVSHGEIDPALLFGAGIYSAAGKHPDIAAWLGEEARRGGHARPPAGDGDASRHEDGVGSFAIHFDRPVPWRGFAVAMGRILTDHASRLLRIKGLMNVAGLATPLVVQCVGGIAYPPVRLPRWPRQGRRFDMRGRLVFIADGLSAEQMADIRARLAALADDAAATRAAATTPLLPTRCWLGERLPSLGRDGFETEGWFVRPVHHAARRTAPAAHA